MKKKLSFLMAVLLALMTPASVLAEEDISWTSASEEVVSEDTAEAYAEEEIADAEEAHEEEAVDTPEVSYEESAVEGSQEEIVLIDDGIPTEEEAEEADVVTEYTDDFIISIEEVEEVPTTFSEVMELDDANIVASGDCGSRLTWTLDNEGVLTISGTGTMRSYSRSSIPWLSYIESIYTVVIEDGVTSIGNYAFYSCSELTSATIPESLTSIGSYAFYGCSNLTSVAIPEGVTSIDSYAFYNCTSLQDIYYDGSKENWEAILIDEYAFTYAYATIHCSDGTINLEKVTIASGTCGDDLTWLLDEEGTLTIRGTGSMTDWSKSSEVPWRKYEELIYSVIVEAGVTSIGDRAFQSIDYTIKTVSLPASLTSIGEYAFGACGIKDVYFDGTIQDWASISMDISYVDDDESGFLTATFHFSGESESIIAGGACGDDLIWKLDDTGVMTISGAGKMTDFGGNLTGVWNARWGKIFTLLIEDGVTSIGDHAFRNLYYLTDVAISDTVTKIGNYAFENCDSLTDFTIPGGVTEISEYAFAYCDNLETITIPNSVTSIGEATFCNCVSLKQITIPDSVTSIGNYIFYGCTSLSDVALSQNIKGISQYAFSGCTSLTDIVLPDKCQEIASYAFQNCTALKSITFSNSITGIGEAAFDGCTKLTDVYFNGSKSEWSKITISTSNLPLTNATIHYGIEELSSDNVSLSATSYTYNGSAKQPTVEVLNAAGKELKNGTDYTVSYKNNTKAGTATVTVEGIGNYAGTVTKNFTIKKASPSLTAKAASSSIVKGKTTKITAKGNGTGKITYSTSNKSIATVSSSGTVTAKAPGSVKITVKKAADDNYNSASKTLTIKVNPKATSLKSAKSSSSKKLTVKWKKVSGVTGYQIQYSTSKTFKSGSKTKSVNVSGASKVSKTISKLKKGKTYYVRVRTYKKVSGTKYYSSWTSKKKVKIK